MYKLLTMLFAFSRLRQGTQAAQPQASPPPAPPRHRPLYTMFRRGMCGLLVSMLLAVLAALPWPTAWTCSALIAPMVLEAQTWVYAHLDALAFSVTIFALIEPLLQRVALALWRLLRATIRAVVRTPRALWLLARWIRIQIVVAIWRFRNWRIRRELRSATT